MQRLETVRIVTENGPVLINKSDFDPEKHRLHGDGKLPEEQPDMGVLHGRIREAIAGTAFTMPAAAPPVMTGNEEQPDDIDTQAGSEGGTASNSSTADASATSLPPPPPVPSVAGATGDGASLPEGGNGVSPPPPLGDDTKAKDAYAVQRIGSKYFVTETPSGIVIQGEAGEGKDGFKTVGEAKALIDKLINTPPAA